MLKNAVSQVNELRIVAQQATQQAIKDGRPLLFEQYVTLLLSAAADFDKSVNSQGKRKGNFRPQRAVYHTDVDDFSSPQIDLDTDLETIEAFAAAQCLPHSRMAFRRWKRLSNDGQATWDGMSDEDKAIILGPEPPGNGQPSPRLPVCSPATPGSSA